MARVSALRELTPGELGMLYIAPTVEPALDLDPGYSWWPRRLGWIEELGWIISEEGHPWLELVGGLLFLGLLMVAVTLFMALGA